mgnify:FL=1
MGEHSIWEQGSGLDPSRAGRIPDPYPLKGHWEYNLYEHLKGLPDQSHYRFITDTPGVHTAGYWTDWCRAIFYAGTGLLAWNEVPELKAAFLTACALEEGADVFLIGKHTEDSGLEPAIHSILHNWGHMTVKEIGPRANVAVMGLGPVPAPEPGGHGPAPCPGVPSAAVATWDFDYLDSVPDGSLDRVILFQAASHVADWERFAGEVGRVLGKGGRLIIAEAPLGGKEFREALHLDSLYESFILRVLSGLGVTEDQLPSVGPDELAELFRLHLTWSRSFSHQGIYLFYGQKGGVDRYGYDVGVDDAARCEYFMAFPPVNTRVREFLDVRPVRDTWSLLTRDERDLWGATIGDIEAPHLGRCATWGGGSLCWNWRNQRAVTDIMWSNLAVKPGDKVMMISEFPEDLGTLPELQQRVGAQGEIVKIALTTSPSAHDFADEYPDGHFDVIWMPQGMRHCDDWLRDAPRLLRILRPGGQVMAIECGINRPEMAAARAKSALARVVGDRVFKIALPEWLVGPLGPEGPSSPGTGHRHEARFDHDVSADQLREAFGDGLTDVCALEHKGWVLFWGYKR